MVTIDSPFAIRPMNRHTTSLNDNRWQFGQVERRPFNAPNVFDLPAVREWLPATIPGNVSTDLLALGRIPDPFLAEGYKESLWVEDLDWWYRRTVQVNALAPQQRAFLIFHGIDYRSAIFINGAEVARHEGMFSRQVLEITAAARRGPLDVAVRVWGSGALPHRKLSTPQKLWKKFGEALYRSWVGIYSNRTATLKCQMSFGWDFAPSIRTMGIWDDVELLVTGPVFIQELRAGDQGLGNSRQQSAISLQLSLNSRYSTASTATIALSPANFQGDAPSPFHFPLHLPAGNSRISLKCPLPPVATMAAVGSRFSPSVPPHRDTNRLSLHAPRRRHPPHRLPHRVSKQSQRHKKLTLLTLLISLILPLPLYQLHKLYQLY